MKSGTTTNLVMATAAFALTFWAWNLVGPLAPSYSENLGLSPTQTSVLIAFPVLIGAVGRIPVGALTDRYGGRVMMAAVCFVSVPPVLLLGMFNDSYTALLVLGFLLGVAGTSFAVGVPFVSRWHAPEKRGFATGVFGAGMGGTALSALFTPRLAESVGVLWTHVLMAAALVVMGLAVLAVCRNAPDWEPSTDPVMPRIRSALGLKATWQNVLLYAVAFGGFVAFSTYLPTLLVNTYEFAKTDAGLRTAGFALVAVAARPAGGILSDRIGPVKVCLTSFLGTSLMALVLLFEPPAELPAGTVFVLTAAFLGLGTGGVFALVAQLVEPRQVGTVTGLVGAAGGLGGYFPPLLMGIVYQSTGGYALGFGLLAAVALGTAAYTAAAFRTRRAVPA
ncbi:MFS transporter [Nocardiopsis algeriensis]|uniref:NNP family nitrate/nitrite transporter-like MFS transporter n=1 Tax=Nocardiopsis algeriensis TaxID=1478215 RepID=A0A841IZV2_9ACTN|nr:MFS transporter [Nocardiopsis algeriensis]MBB6121651.1 NNP family nitrate/nitrite transporter-like MFS transporter [Nocardiopsis algeriensis]